MEQWPSEQKLHAAFDKALAIVDRNIEKFGNDFPARCCENQVYEREGNIAWTAGFWPGILWLCYEMTGDEKYAAHAESYVDSFCERIEKRIMVKHHDMGFLYSPSCVAAYQLKGNEKAKKAAIMAADLLCERFMEKGQFLNAWSDINNIKPENNFYIVDCMLNIPLLYWATEQTGDEHYSEIAKKHLKTTMDTIIRPNNSTYHSFLFDLETGAPLRGKTQQGYSDSSTWSRGQAWGVLGFALNYAETLYEKDVDCFKRVTDYFIKNLPKDGVACWDLDFTDDSQPRDSSASIVTVCGILEMEKYIKDDEMKEFSKAGAFMLNSLIDNYAASADMNTDGLLLHATGSLPHGMGVDEPCIFGDYFYLEAILRLLKKDWKMYW